MRATEMPRKRRVSTIGFRLEAQEIAILSERAEKLGVSPHELARSYVLELLGASEERTALREGVVTLHNVIGLLREDLALSVEALLISAGKVSEEQARKWAEENLNTD